MQMRDLHPVDRPRERLLRRGAAGLSDAELLAVLLRTGYKGMSALDVSRELLRLHPGPELGRQEPRLLARVKGVGPTRAAALAAAAELGRRWTGGEPDGGLLSDPARVWELLHDLRGRRQEHFVALYTDARHRLLHRETVSVGTLTASLVHPREVFAPAVERRAAGVIVSHNHPSGDPRPSAEDREATRRLARAGELLGISLLDHVLVTERSYFSFRAGGLL